MLYFVLSTFLCSSLAIWLLECLYTFLLYLRNMANTHSISQILNYFPDSFHQLQGMNDCITLNPSSSIFQVRLLYKGTLRVLLVLLHDFPEFLCEHHFSFCDVIPPSCIQMRNLILSAFPRNMRLPDPFTPNLKVIHCSTLEYFVFNTPLFLHGLYKKGAFYTTNNS